MDFIKDSILEVKELKTLANNLSQYERVGDKMDKIKTLLELDKKDINIEELDNKENVIIKEDDSSQLNQEIIKAKEDLIIKTEEKIKELEEKIIEYKEEIQSQQSVNESNQKQNLLLKSKIESFKRTIGVLEEKQKDDRKIQFIQEKNKIKDEKLLKSIYSKVKNGTVAINELISIIEEKESFVNTLKKKNIVLLKEKNKDINNYKNVILKTSKVVEKLVNENKNINKHINEKNIKIRKINSLLEIGEKTVSKLERKLEKQESVIKESRKKIASYKNDLNTFKSFSKDNSKYKELIKIKTKQVASLKEDVLQTKNKLENLKKEKNILVKEDGKKEQKHKQLKSIIEVLNKKLEILSISNAKLLYSNKVFLNESLGKTEKETIIERLMSEKSVSEVRSTFELMNNPKKEQKRKNWTAERLQENFKKRNVSSNKPNADVRDSTLEDNSFLRMQQIAGLVEN